MTDEPLPLHPDDLRKVIDEVMMRGVVPTAGSPPVKATGADAAMFNRIVQQAIERNKEAIAGPDDAFLRRVVQEQMHEFAESLGLRVDEAHKGETRDAIISILAMRKTTFGIVKVFVYALVGGLATWIMAHFDLKALWTGSGK